MKDDIRKKSNQNNYGLISIKSNYLLKKITANLKIKKLLQLIKQNKFFLNKLGKNIDSFKKCLQIEVEIEIQNNKYGKFINYLDDEKSYFHIFFDDNKEEIKRNEITQDDKVIKIKIIIDYESNFFSRLFMSCNYIKKINFTKFERKNIYDMSNMFSSCSSLEELDISNIKTDKLNQ